MSGEYTPPEPPEENGFYWAYLLWEFGDEFTSIVEVRRGTLLALTLTLGETPTYRPLIPHDVLRWGPKLEFPTVQGTP